MVKASGVLYVVATPIGHLGDISQRAIDILGLVDLIAAEDTRHTAKLLQVQGISKPMIAYHEHNESHEAPRLVAMIASGTKLALVSDAGTPLVSDPGFRLVRETKRLGYPVIPIPGPSALICALSASGLPSDRFLFLGFPPRGKEQRQSLLRSLLTEPGTIIFYEAGPRLQETLLDLDAVFGQSRNVVLARELTKRHETFLEGIPSVLAARLLQDPVQTKGEHVLLVAGAGQQPAKVNVADQESTRILRILLEELSVKQAVGLAAQITGGTRNDLYRQALAIRTLLL